MWSFFNLKVVTLSVEFLFVLCVFFFFFLHQLFMIEIDANYHVIASPLWLSQPVYIWVLNNYFVFKVFYSIYGNVFAQNNRDI